MAGEDHSIVSLANPAVQSCWLCGTRLPAREMVADGGSACADLRWYCADTRRCTERWTSHWSPGIGADYSHAAHSRGAVAAPSYSAAGGRSPSVTGGPGHGANGGQNTGAPVGQGSAGRVPPGRVRPPAGRTPVPSRARARAPSRGGAPSRTRGAGSWPG